MFLRYISATLVSIRGRIVAAFMWIMGRLESLLSGSDAEYGYEGVVHWPSFGLLCDFAFMEAR